MQGREGGLSGLCQTDLALFNLLWEFGNKLPDLKSITTPLCSPFAHMRAEKCLAMIVLPPRGG